MKNYTISNIKSKAWAKTWPGLVIPQRNPLLYNNSGKARGDAG